MVASLLAMVAASAAIVASLLAMVDASAAIVASREAIVTSRASARATGSTVPLITMPQKEKALNVLSDI